jgi:PAS domain S-box-containing protein
LVGTAEVNFVVISNIFLVQNTLDSAKNSKMPSLSKVFESLSLSILITDEKFEVVYTNNSFNNFFDGNEKEIELKNIVGNKFYSELRSFANEAFNLDLVSEHDLNYTSLEGDSVLLNVRVQQYEENKNTYVIFIFKDVSQTRVNQKIKAYKESLDKMNIE